MVLFVFNRLLLTRWFLLANIYMLLCSKSRLLLRTLMISALPSIIINTPAISTFHRTPRCFQQARNILVPWQMASVIDTDMLFHRSRRVRCITALWPCRQNAPKISKISALRFGVFTDQCSVTCQVPSKKLQLI